jgi:hypothetical protein
MKRFVLVLLPFLFVAVILFISPPTLESTIQVPGRIGPRLEWSLLHSERGQLISVLHDHLEGATKHFAVVDFDRGDHMSFALHPGLGTAVSIGDTIGSFHSAELQRQQVRLQGQLASEMDALAMYEVGGKAADIEENKLVLDYRKTQLDWHEREMVRLRSLREQDLVPQAAFEAAENELALRRMKVDIAAASLQSVKTGAKERELQWRQTRVRGLRAELDLLQQRLEQSTILSPLVGRISSTSARDTLAVVRDTISYIVLMPIRWEDRDYLKVGLEMEFQIEGADRRLSGRIASVGDQIQVINGEQFLPVKALISPDEKALVAGLMVRCVLKRAAVGPWEFIWRLFAA